MNNEIKIRLNENTTIVAQLNEWIDTEPAEICIWLQDNDGVAIQDICLVRPNARSNDKDEVEVLVWGDEDSEDYTEEYIIKEHKYEV